MPGLSSAYDSDQKIKIGVILPLSGKFKPVGQKILKGIELASGIFEGKGTDGIEYIIRDYESDETKLPDVIDALDKDNVVAIIGPMGSQACRPAQKKRIPTFIFSQESLPAKESPCCFGNFLTIDTQTKTLLKTAQENGIQRFAILAPATQVGKMFSDSLTKTAPQYRIEVVLLQEYAYETKDFSGVVRQFRESLRMLKGPSKTTKAKKQPTSPEALMIPDSARNACIIAAYLTNYGIKGLALYGPASWDTPDLVRLGGKHIEGAYFISGFYTENTSVSIHDFISSFNGTFETSPTIWEASAYDTVNIIKMLVEKGANSRDNLIDAIITVKDYQGASGTISFESDGTTKKDVTLLTVRDGAVIEVGQ